MALKKSWSLISFLLPVYSARTMPRDQGRMHAIGKEGQLQATSILEKTVGGTISPGLYQRLLS